MVLMFDMKYMYLFDEKYYKKYMILGDRFDFLVWLCILLYKDGFIVVKGIVEVIMVDIVLIEILVFVVSDIK